MRNIVAIAAAFAPAVVLACQPQMERRAVNAARQLDRSNEAAEAQITDKQAECSYYNYEPVNAIINSYPDIWKTADLSASGIQQSDRDLFASINSSIPDIPVRGNRYGDFTGIVYNTTGDPDCWWSATHCVTPAASSGLHNDTIDCNEANTWGFTLDDGPNCSHNAFYDYLQERKQKATLFYIGSNVLDWPLEAQRGLADGHEICAHTWSHHMTGLTNEEVFSELYFSKKAIKEVLGVTVRCWRPPYGDVDNRVRYIADKLDMRTVVWNQDTDDWNWSNVGMAAVRQNYQGILGRQTAGKFNHSGTIVLTHELDNGTMSLVEDFLPQIQQQFVGGVMPVAVCLNNSRPYIEQADYLYPNYDQWMSGTTSMSLAAPTATSIASLALSPTAVPTSSAASSSATAASSGAAASSAARALVSTGSRVSGSQASSTAGATHKSGALVRSAAGLPVIIAAVGMAAYSLA